MNYPIFNLLQNFDLIGRVGLFNKQRSTTAHCRFSGNFISERFKKVLNKYFVCTCHCTNKIQYVLCGLDVTLRLDAEVDFHKSIQYL